MTALAYAYEAPVSLASAKPRRRFPLLGHVPALDGLRGLAVAMVVVFHFVGHDIFKGGWLGVDVFFGLSGFLITALVLDEQRVHGRVRLALFYGRRACRLLPALLLLLAVWVVMLLLFHDQTWFAATPSGNGTGRTVDVGGALSDVGLALVYVANWNVIDGGMEAPLSHLWSLAVEEQFYLVWPGLLVVLLGLGHRVRLSVVAALMAASALLPALLGAGAHDHIYFGTDTRVVGLLGGRICGARVASPSRDGAASPLGGLARRSCLCGARWRPLVVHQGAAARCRAGGHHAPGDAGLAKAG